MKSLQCSGGTGVFNEFFAHHRYQFQFVSKYLNIYRIFETFLNDSRSVSTV